MNDRFPPERCIAAWCALAFGGVAWARPADDLAYLVRASAGEKTADTGLEGQTKPEIVQEPALGGKALKVAFGRGDSVGSPAKVKDWTAFAKFRVATVNPGGAAALELNIVHSKSKNYETRVVVTVTLPPGKGEIVVPLAGLKNTDGSAPALDNVVKWYLADAAEQAPTVVFGDVALEKEGAAPPPMPNAAPAQAPAATALPTALAGAGMAGGFRVQGSFGGQLVDLRITPLGAAPAVGLGAAPAPAATVAGNLARAQRLRQAKMPALTRPVMFDTPEADAICAALEVYPDDNPFNQPVDSWPLHPDSAAIVASIGAGKPLRYNPDMAFVLVPPNQPRVAVKNAGYVEESDPGPFPIPASLPIEGWPAHFQREEGGKWSLDDVQRNRNKDDGDRHAIVVDPARRILHEFYQMKKAGAGWEAHQTSTFDLKSNKLRPDNWTSADAAGLPIFPATVRFDELERGAIEHALRLTVGRSRKAYVHPATHQAGHGDEPGLPRMGERLRLKAGVDASKFTPPVKTILQALKTYGAFVADNGLDWCVSVTPDARIPVLHDELRKLKGSDFEVVVPPPGYEPPTGK